MNVREALNDYLLNLPEEQMRSLTIGNVIDLSQEFYQKAIGQSYPKINPEVLEALLLLQKHLSKQMFSYASSNVRIIHANTLIMDLPDTFLASLIHNVPPGGQFESALKKTLDTLTK